MNHLQIKYLTEEAREKAPFKLAYKGDAAYDLYNASGDNVIVFPNQLVNIAAGLAVKMPDGFCGRIVPRSSTFSKRGVMVVQGLIDSGYTGPLFTNVWNPMWSNNGAKPIVIKPWERISQLLIHHIPELELVVLPENGTLPKTERGESGFGSSGL